MRILVPLGLAAGLALCAAGAPARAEGLAVNAGLWEVDLGAGMPQMPQISADQLAKMPPAMQKMIQQRLAAAGQGSKHKFCVTQAMLDRGFNPSADEKSHCKRTPISEDATELDFKLECTGSFKASGTVHVSVVDRENLKTVMDMQMTMHGGTEMPMHREMQSHWLGADCGDVKPPPQYQ